MRRLNEIIVMLSFLAAGLLAALAHPHVLQFLGQFLGLIASRTIESEFWPWFFLVWMFVGPGILFGVALFIAGAIVCPLSLLSGLRRLRRLALCFFLVSFAYPVSLILLYGIVAGAKVFLDTPAASSAPLVRRILGIAVGGLVFFVVGAIAALVAAQAVRLATGRYPPHITLSSLVFVLVTSLLYILAMRLFLDFWLVGFPSLGALIGYWLFRTGQSARSF